MVTSQDKQQAIGKQPKNGTATEKFEAPSQQQSSPVIEKRMEKGSIQVMYFDDNKNHVARKEESREEMQRHNGVNVVEDVRDTLPTVDLDKLHMAAASIVHKFGNHVVSCLDVPTLVTDAKMRQDDELLMAATSSVASTVDNMLENNVVVADASTISIPHGSNDDVGHKTSDYTNDDEGKWQQKKILQHLTSSIFNERDGHTLDFANISLSAKTKKGNKDILKGVSSSFQPKTLTALMGPSGSGKTSLLKVLTGRLSNKSSKLNLAGTIKLDGRIVDPTSINIRKQIAYVEQDVSIPATSTPREAIRFSARLRLDKSVSDEEIDSLTDDILENLGLSHVADNLVGGGLVRGGLSGGEKKRVQCGIELVTNPEIIVLDEPTSGLDSFSALSLMDILQKIANAGATVIVTIHQPPPPVVRKIDKLLLLRSGQLLYNGPLSSEVEEYFAQRGFPKPLDYNIADWVMEIAQTTSLKELEMAGFFQDETKYATSNSQLYKDDDEPDLHSVKRKITNHVGYYVQLRLLFGREIKKLLRDKISFLITVASSASFGLLFGCIFFQVGQSPYTEYPEVMASFGALSNLLISTMFGSAQNSLTAFPRDRPVFLREYSTNHYSVIPYFLANFSTECVTIFIQVLSQQMAAWFLMGFRMNFFLFLGLNFVLSIASTSIGIFVGCVSENPEIAGQMIPVLIVPQLLFSGFFIQINLIPKFLRWAQYLCSLNYASKLAMRYEFGSCQTVACQGLLEDNNSNMIATVWYWMLLVAIGATFRIASMIVLRRKATF